MQFNEGLLELRFYRLLDMFAFFLTTRFFLNPRDASNRSRIFLFSLVYVCMYVFIYLCHASWPNEKQQRHILPQALSKNGFFCFFEKNPRKTAVSRGFSVYLLHCLVFYLFVYRGQNELLLPSPICLLVLQVLKVLISKKIIENLQLFSIFHFPLKS